MRNIYDQQNVRKALNWRYLILFPSLIILFVMAMGFESKAQTLTGTDLCYTDGTTYTDIGVNTFDLNKYYSLYRILNDGSYFRVALFYISSNPTGPHSFGLMSLAGRYVGFESGSTSPDATFLSSGPPSGYNPLTGDVYIFAIPVVQVLDFSGAYTEMTPDVGVFCGTLSGELTIPSEGIPLNYGSEWTTYYQLYNGVTAVGAAKPGTGSPLLWTGLDAGTNYNVTALRGGGCATKAMTGSLDIDFGTVENTTDGLCYLTIQDAITATATTDGETIACLQEATPYTENLIIDKEITLQSNTGLSAEIDGSIDISANNVIIQDFFMVWSSGNYAIKVISTYGNYVIKNIQGITTAFSMLDDGILIENNAGGGTIEGNVISLNKRGINIAGSLGGVLKIKNNLFEENITVDILNNANNVEITDGNYFTNCPLGIQNSGTGVKINNNNFDNIDSPGGIAIYNSTTGTVASCNGNSFGGADYSRTAINNASATLFNALSNFYGSAKGPTLAANPCGDGWVITGPVTYSPWYSVETLYPYTPPAFPTFSVSVLVSQLAAAITAQTDVSCKNGSDGSVTVTATDGISPYEYKLDAGSYQPAPGTFTGLSANTYTVTAMDGQGCTVAVQVIITEPDELDATVSTTQSIFCAGGDIVITLPTGGYGTFQYSADGGSTWTGSMTTGYTFTPLAAGNYSVKMRDGANITCIKDLGTYTVGGLSVKLTHLLDPPTYYATISLAVAAAVDGDVIDVCAGTYPEQVNVDKDITINGPNAGTKGNATRVDEAIVDGEGTHGCFLISVPNVTIDGFKIIRAGSAWGGVEPWTSPTSGTKILNNIIFNNTVGINETGTDWQIKRNLFDGNNYGPGPGAGAGLYVDWNTNGLVIDDNEFKNHLINSAVIFSTLATTHQNVTFTNNYIHNNNAANSMVYCMAVVNSMFSNNTITEPGTRAIKFAGACHGNQVQYNYLDNNGIGVKSADDGPGPNYNNTVSYNSLSSCSDYSIDNGETTVMSAHCNWYGTSDVTLIPAKVNGPVAWSPFLTTSDIVTPVCNGSAPVMNTTKDLPFLKIQPAVSSTYTEDGNQITVAAGEYAENVIVDKSLTILGPNASIDPCQLAPPRVPEAIVRPAVVRLEPNTDGTIFRLGKVSGPLTVTIKGFTIDGNNPALGAGRSLNGVVVHTGTGITNSISSIDTEPGGYKVTLDAENNIIQNLERYGVYVNGVDISLGHIAIAGSVVDHNKIDNLPSGNVYGGGRGRAAAFGWDVYGTFTNNCITRVNVGWQDDNHWIASPGAGTIVSNNNISSYHRGIFHNNQWGGATNAIITNNHVFAESANNTGTDFGVELCSIQQTVGAIVTGNEVTGKTYGILLWNNPTTSTITVSGGILTNNTYGVYATNYDPQFGNGAASNYLLSGITISGGTNGVTIMDDAVSTHGGVNLGMSGCNITGVDKGVKFQESLTGTIGGSVTGNTISAKEIGIDVPGLSTTTYGLTIQGNSVTLAGQLIGMSTTPTVGIALNNISGSSAAVIGNNNILAPFYGYLVYNLNTSAVTNITGGNISGIMQGVAISNFNPMTGLYAPSAVDFTGLNIFAFGGDYTGIPALAPYNFHAGIYAYTGGGDNTKTITSAITGVSISGTGKISQDCAGLSFSDFSTGAGVRQNMTVNTSFLTDNLNRGINVRGINAVADINGCTLTGNGKDAFGPGGNNGFGIVAFAGATATVDECFITNPASAPTPVSALMTFPYPTLSGTITAFHNSFNRNGFGWIADNNGGTLTATCNWWGTVVSSAVLAQINPASAPPVTYINYLVDGTDTDFNPLNGFQPNALSCYGSPIALNCVADQEEAACQTQAAINAAFTTWLGSTTYSGCNGVITTDPVTPTAPSFCGGSTVVKWTYTSDCGILVCTKTFSVIYDNLSPTVSAPTTVDIECTTGLPDAATTITQFLALPGASASDNCTAESDLLVSSVTGALVGTNCSGTITRTYTITDLCGKFTNVDHVFTVTDNTVPLATGPANKTIEGCDELTAMPQPKVINVAAAQAPDTYYVDRYAPYGFSVVSYLGEERLKQSIDESDCEPCRPSGFNNSFYNYQGRGYNTPGALSLAIDLYVPSTWSSPGGVRAGLWGVGNNFYFPIVEFTNEGGPARFRFWDDGPSQQWIDMGLPGGFAYNNWYTLSMRLVGPNIVMTVGDLTLTLPTNGAVSFNSFILQGHNNVAGVTYDIYWDNFRTLGVNLAYSAVPTSITASQYSAEGGSATDNCSDVSISYTDSKLGTCPTVVTRVFTILDECLNPTTKTQIITIDDTQAPAITTCPPLQNIEGCSTAAITPLAYSETPVSVTLIQFTAEGGVATDACGVTTWSYQDSKLGTCPTVVTRVWTVGDACGNTITCNQTINVDDNIAPTISDCAITRNIEGCGTASITGPAYSTTLATSSEAEFEDGTNQGVASDVCGITSVKYIDVASGTCPTIVTRTWTLKDACDNTNTCNQTINVDDTQVPIITDCGPAQTVYMGQSCTAVVPNFIPNVVASDVCGVVSVTQNPLAGSPASVGFNQSVTITVKDACDNTETCPNSFDVIAAPKTALTTQNVCTGTNNVVVPVTVTEFIKVTSVSLVINYNTAVLDFVGAINVQPYLLVNEYVSGTIVIVSNAMAETSYLVPTELLKLKFNVIGSGNGWIEFDQTYGSSNEYGWGPSITAYCDDPFQDFYTNGAINGYALPVLGSLNLQSSTNAGGPWSSVGTYLGNYYLCTDPAEPYYYLDLASMTVTPSLQTGYMNPFTLTGVTNPLGFAAYWAAKGVYPGCPGTWEPIMAQIITGGLPMFFVYETVGGDYQLIDGLQWEASGHTVMAPLRLNGNYFQDIYSFSGTLKDVNGCVSAAIPMNLQIKWIPTINAGPDQYVCMDAVTVTMAGYSFTGATGADWSGGNGGSWSGNVYTPSAADKLAGFVTLTYTTNTAAPCGDISNDMIVYFNPLPVLGSLDLQSSTNVSGPWSSVGMYLGNYYLCTDPAEPYYYLDLASMTVTPSLQTGYMNPFKLTSVTNPLGFAAYWAAKGVYPGCGGTWEPIMEDILEGDLPMFFVYETGGDYQLIDGLQWEASGHTVMAPLRLNGNYFQDTYSFSGTLKDVNGCVSAPIPMKLQIKWIPTVNPGADQTVCADVTTVTMTGYSVGGGATTGLWSGGGGSWTGNVYTPTAGEIASGSVVLIYSTTDAAPCVDVNDTKTVFFKVLPTVDAGPDQSYCVTVTTVTMSGYSVGGGATTGVWSGGSGSWAVDVYTPTAGEIAAGSVVLTYSTTDAAPCGDVYDTKTVFFNSQVTLTGSVKYYNIPFLGGLGTNMNNVTVTLKDGLGNTVGTNVINFNPTNASGVYSITNICPGTYDVYFSTGKTTGGAINGTDAAQVNQWAIGGNALNGPYSIERVRFDAGDVIGVPTLHKLQTTDAQSILNYFLTGGNPVTPFPTIWNWWMTNSWSTLKTVPAPYIPYVVIPGGPTTVTQNFYGMVTGDFNCSFIPGNAKSTSINLTLNDGATILVNPGAEVDVPVFAGSNLEIGAISMILNFPSEKLEIVDVLLGDISNSPVPFNVIGDELRIGWYSISAMSLKTGEKMLTLKVRIKGSVSQGETIKFVLAGSDLNELADAKAEVIQNAVLFMDMIGGTIGINDISGSEQITFKNYPNPFTEQTTFAYSIPADGKVTIEVYSMLGSKVKTLVNEEQKAGDHFFSTDARFIETGVYMATLKLKTNNGQYDRMIKIVRSH